MATRRKLRNTTNQKAGEEEKNAKERRGSYRLPSLLELKKRGNVM